MKFAFCMIFFSLCSLAQNLSAEEQKRLIEENKLLKAELQKMNSSPSPKESQQIMESLKKGQRYQEEANKYLEELDKEE